MNLHELNTLGKAQLHEVLSKCCGSTAWVEKMMHCFPVEDLVDLMEDAEEKWAECSQQDWLEAFTYHPKIGDTASLRKKFASTAAWAEGEQSGATTASEQVIEALAKENDAYEKKFGYIFIVCATGKSAEEMLEILRSRISNDPATEIQIAADEQNKITQLRLEKLLA